MPQSSSTLHKSDLVVNYIFLFISAVSGLAATGLISRLYNLSALGVFNLLLGLYFAYSQAAVFGIHNSVNFLAAKSEEGGSERSLHLSSAMGAALIFGSLVSLLFAFSGPIVAKIFGFEDLFMGMLYAAPALLFFAWNKVFLAYLNAVGRQLAFGIGQGIRGLLLLISILGIYFMGFPSRYLPLSLPITEIVLFVILGFQLRASFSLQGLFHGERIRGHLTFGVRGLWSNVFIELNSKVDVLMLGYFTDEKILGIYSLASTFIEGFQLLFMTLRSLLHPKVVQEFERGGKDFLKNLFIPWKRIVYLYSLPVTILACAAFYLILPVISADSSARIPAFMTFTILALGVYLASGYLVFSNLFYQIGKPGLQSIFSAILILTNIFLNLLLIPLFKGQGAAAATAIATASVVFLLPFMARRFGSVDFSCHPS